MINSLIAKVLPYMPKRLVWVFSQKYIAGELLADALRESEKLNREGCSVTIDILGEYILKLSDADPYKAQYIQAIEQFRAAKVIGNFSLKPSMFGLLLDKEVCYQNIREIVSVAQQHNNFIRIDMEDSSCTDDELLLYRRLKEEFTLSVGLVLQSYLRRTVHDLEQMMDMHTAASPLNFRLCKGIYVEDQSVAYKAYQEIRDHYLKDLEFMLQHGIYVGIATHDAYLVEEAIQMIKKYHVPKDKFEFQMLFGVASNLRRSIIEKGYPMRVYVPYGKQWFNYSTRRLKENPNMVWHIMKAVFVSG